MRKTKLLYSLALAPLLLGGYNYANIGQESEALTVQALPQCPDGQFLVYRSNAVVCEAVKGSGVALPDCKTKGDLLTYTKIGELAQFACTRHGSISLSSTDQTTITNLQTQITQIGTTIKSIGTGAQVASRTYRGPSKVNFDGAMGGGGILAANARCATDYGVGASMCDVYSMYISIAAAKIDPKVADIANSWVYQAAWTNSLPAGDNCNGYTSNTGAGGVFGTSFTLTAATGNAARVPKFYSNTACTVSQPVACCQ